MSKQLSYGAIALLAVMFTACSFSEETPKSASIPQVTSTPAPPSDTTFFQGMYSPKSYNLVDAVDPGSSFFEFRERLRTAVRDRDADYLRSISTAPIKLGFGVAPNRIDDLDIDNPNAPVWQYLEKAIATGCADANELYSNSASTSESWVCPHVFAMGASIDRAEFPTGTFAWEVLLVGGEIPVRSEAKADSELISTLSNERALLDGERLKQFQSPVSSNGEPPEWYSTKGWIPIILPSGQRGYVENRYLYDVNGYRAFFSNRDGKWQMEALVSGD